jgi:hypothetical protein
MKIILDANIFLADVQLRSNRFNSLFVFMRRTGSALVIPNLVLEEILETHQRALNEKVGKLQSAADEVRRLLGDQGSVIAKTEKIFSTKVNIPKEIESLRQRLLNPAPGIRVVLAEEKIDIKDVYRRGILRKRPASEKGEELRDVILWLFVLHQAQEEKIPVAFIARDKTFWDAAARLHPDLASEIASSNVDVRVYPDVEEFNKANALASMPYPPEEIRQLIDIRTLNDQIIDKVKIRLDGMDLGDSIITFRGGSVALAAFDAGTIYEVQPNTRFAEIPYRAKVEVTVVANLKPKLDYDWASFLTAKPASVETRQGPLTVSFPRADEVEMKVVTSVIGRASLRIVDGKIESAEIDTAVIGTPESNPQIS